MQGLVALRGLWAAATATLALVALAGCGECNDMAVLRSAMSPDKNYEAVLAREECVRFSGSSRYRVIVYKLPREDRRFLASSREEVLNTNNAETLAMSWPSNTKLVLSCPSCDIKSEYMSISKSRWDVISFTHDGFPSK